MKTKTIASLITGIILFTACTKENTSFQSSDATDESLTQVSSSDASELVGAQAVRIGTQVWKIKDLTTSFYRNGDRVQQVQDPNKWKHLTKGAWCWYNNDSTMGKLYNWYAVNDPRGLAPEGWHIPSDAEWTTLSTYLGGEIVAGGKMKETGTTHWLAPNIGATNSSGFTGLPGGYRGYDGFSPIGFYGYWWSSTENGTNVAWYRTLYYGHGLVGKLNFDKRLGCSVRCVKD